MEKYLAGQMVWLKVFYSMFDELKEVKKLLQRNNRFQEPYNVKYVWEIKSLKCLQRADAYLEAKRASTMELFCEYTKWLTTFAIKSLS